MPRFAFEIEYDGGPFSGWQRQNDVPSVQGAIEEAISVLEPDAPSLAAAGRTDAGVHAWGQVAHINLVRDWDPFELMQAVNQHLKPAPIAVLRAAKASDDWHSRFSAVERRYMYRIVRRRAPLGIERGRAWTVKHALDVPAMQEAAKNLIGNHDFTTFRSTICQAKSPIKTLDEISFEQFDYPGGNEVRVHFRARSFLHNQVRSLVGSLAKVGSGSWEPARMKDALEARDRAACGPVAIPDGLYLMSVGYPDSPFD